MAELTEIRICPTHGSTEYAVSPRKEGGLKRRCKLCRNENIKNARRKNKKRLVKDFGGGCQTCGYNKCMEALHFHHVDPKTKTIGVARLAVGRARMKSEAEKCILLCANCHYELEYMAY